MLQGNDDASTADASLDKQQDLQLVNQYECNHLTYTINAKPGKLILVLTTKVGLLQDYIHDGNATVQDIIDEYNENKRSFVPKSLLDYPVYINFTLKQLSSGFSPAGSPPKCGCYERLRKIDGVNCNINTKQVERSGTVWVELEYSYITPQMLLWYSASIVHTTIATPKKSTFLCRQAHSVSTITLVDFVASAPMGGVLHLGNHSVVSAPMFTCT